MNTIEITQVIKFNIKGYGEYYFSDTPTSSDENFPYLAKVLMAKGTQAKGEMVEEWFIINRNIQIKINLLFNNIIIIML